jgi:hypothetical protein
MPKSPESATEVRLDAAAVPQEVRAPDGFVEMSAGAGQALPAPRTDVSNLENLQRP